MYSKSKQDPDEQKEDIFWILLREQSLDLSNIARLLCLSFNALSPFSQRQEYTLTPTGFVRLNGRLGRVLNLNRETLHHRGLCCCRYTLQRSLFLFNLRIGSKVDFMVQCASVHDVFQTQILFGGTVVIFGKRGWTQKGLQCASV